MANTSNLQQRDHNLGYEHGYSDVKYGRYEAPCSTEHYNRGYEAGAQARRDFEAAGDRPKTVRIHVDTSVEIDLAAWELNYGEDLTENPDDARDYIETVIREQLKSVGVLAK